MRYLSHCCSLYRCGDITPNLSRARPGAGIEILVVIVNVGLIVCRCRVCRLHSGLFQLLDIPRNNGIVQLGYSPRSSYPLR